MSIYQAQADLQHLWFGRRAATRMRSELMAAIYDKALKRKDYSGIVDKNKIRQEEEAKAKAAETKSSKSEFIVCSSPFCIIHSGVKKKVRLK